MAFEFTETLNISFPDINESLEVVESVDSAKRTKGLIVEVAAIHVGATANFNYYTEEALEGSISSWTEPYGKPVILNHDPFSESVGRVIAARMDTGEEGTPFIRLQAAITSPEAIQKVKDKRYLTGSVGGKADEARCTICDSDWAAKEARGPACAHRKGKVYEGKVAFLKLQKVKFHEYSWVNMPADENSQVLSMTESDIGKCFVLDMDNVSVETFNDSSEKVNLLSGMKKKEALPIYMGLKGSFLTAVALQESENTTNLTKDIENMETNNTNTDSNKISEENFMSKTSESNEDVDLLDVIEGLNEDDTSTDAEETTDTETPETDDASSEDEATSEDEGTEPEGQEEPAGEDAEATEETDGEEDEDKISTDAEGSDDGESEEESTDGSDEGSDDEEDSDKGSEDESNSQLVDEGEADEVSESTEDDSTSETELTAKVGKLEEENARLRKAVHRMLAERVVDAKVAVGIDVGNRAEAVKEHSERTASSLADSIRDLSSMSPSPVSESDNEDEGDTIKPEKLDSEIAAAESEKGAIFEDEDEKETEDIVTEEKSPEDFFVDAFMGRKPL